MEFDAVAASFRADAADAGTFLEVLAKKLEEALPGSVKVRRHGGLFRKDHPVVEIRAQMGDWSFHLERTEEGQLVSERSHAVRGIALSSERMELDQWIVALTEALVERARHSGNAAEALRRFLA